MLSTEHMYPEEFLEEVRRRDALVALKTPVLV